MFNSIPIVQNDTTPVPMSDDFNSQLGAAVSAHWAQFARGKPSWPSYAGGDAAKGVGGYLEISESGTVGPAEGLLAKKCAWCAPSRSPHETLAVLSSDSHSVSHDRVAF